MKTLLSICALALSLFTSAQDKPEGLFINSKAPEIKDTDQSGLEVSLKNLRKKGSVVVIFYRGYWCPYCNKELKRFADSLNLITDKKATVLAVSPEGAEGRSKTVAATGATFSFVTDADAAIARAYKTSYVVDDKTLARYKSFGNDLLSINAQKGQAVLPVPAVYIVNKDGYVTYRFFEPDFRKRPWVADILKNL